MPSRQPPPGWPKGVRQQSIPSPNIEDYTNSNITEQPIMMVQRRKRPHSWPKHERPSTPTSTDEHQKGTALNEDEK